MKRTLLLLSMFIFFIVSSCNKDNKTLEVSIDGLSDITLNENFRFFNNSSPLSINQRGISDENITLTVTGVPARIDLTLSVTNGIPNFSTIMNARLVEDMGNGTYPVKIIAKNDAGVEKTFPFNIIVDLPCYNEVIGNYTLTETIDGVEKTYTTQLAQTSSDRNKVTDYKYYNDLILDCNNKTIKMENSYIYYDGGATGYIYGTGTFTNKTITMDCIIVPNGGGANKIVKRVFTRK